MRALFAKHYVLGAKAVFVVAILVLPLVSSSGVARSVMASAGLYAILTLAVALILGQAGQFSFGHAAFYGIGAYTTGLLALKAHVPTLAAWVAGAAAAGLVALIVGRPVLKLKYFYLALATIGWGRSSWSSRTKRALSVPASPGRLVTRRRTHNWKLLALSGSAHHLARIAGGLLVLTIGAISPNSFTFSVALFPMIMTLSAAAVAFGPVWSARFDAWLSNAFSGALQYSGLIYSIVLILLLLFLPAGLFGLLHGKRVTKLRMRLLPSTGPLTRGCRRRPGVCGGRA